MRVVGLTLPDSGGDRGTKEAQAHRTRDQWRSGQGCRGGKCPPPPPLPPADPKKGGAKIPTSAISDLSYYNIASHLINSCRSIPDSRKHDSPPPPPPPMRDVSGNWFVNLICSHTVLGRCHRHGCFVRDNRFCNYGIDKYGVQ